VHVTVRALHKDVSARGAGKTAQQIIDEFVKQYGEAALMAPPKHGFNLALLRSLHCDHRRRFFLVRVLRRWTRKRKPPLPRPCAVECHPAELERLPRELRPAPRLPGPPPLPMLELILGILLAAGRLTLSCSRFSGHRRNRRVAMPSAMRRGPADDMSRRRSRCAALKEIEFDRATGKLSDADYEQLKAKYTEAALAAMRGERG